MQAGLQGQQPGAGQRGVEPHEAAAILVDDVRYLEAQGIQRHINPAGTRIDEMGSRLQAVFGALIVSGAALLLGGCSEDLGLDQHGQKVTSERFENQWLVINYWAEWCAPCRTEIPELNALAEQLRGQGVQVMGVNFDGLQGAELEKASRQMGIGFTVLAQDPSERFKLPRSEALPVTYILDARGQVRERLLGEQTAKGLSERLAGLRQEKP